MATITAPLPNSADHCPANASPRQPAVSVSVSASPGEPKATASKDELEAPQQPQSCDKGDAQHVEVPKSPREPKATAPKNGKVTKSVVVPDEGPPLVSDSSESQMPIPAHDFAFYEWDFREDEEKPKPHSHPIHVAATTTIKSSPETVSNLVVVEEELQPRVLQKDPSACHSTDSESIEELMGPSIYRSQLSRELGPARAAELHSELFDGVVADLSNEFKEKEVPVPEPALAASVPPVTVTSPPERAPHYVREGSRVRHHTVDAVHCISTHTGEC